MPNYTKNYKLQKPLGTEEIDIDVLNANMDTLDTKIKETETSITSKDATAVHKTGTETVTGKKTFSGGITGLPTPTANTDAVNKSYVDSATSGKANNADVVHITGAENITGAKTFSTPPVVPVPTANGQAVNKEYADIPKFGTTTYVGGGTADPHLTFDFLPDRICIMGEVSGSSNSATLVLQKVFTNRNPCEYYYESRILINGGNIRCGSLWIDVYLNNGVWYGTPYLGNVRNYLNAEGVTYSVFYIK